MPTASERLVWAQGGPEDVKLITTTLPSQPSTPLKISATICWENYMPLLRQHLYDQGTQLYCAPTVDGREVWLSSMTHIALEGRCFVLSACQMSIRSFLVGRFVARAYLDCLVSFRLITSLKKRITSRLDPRAQMVRVSK